MSNQVKFNATLMWGYLDKKDEEGSPQASQYPDGKYKVTLTNLNEAAVNAINSLGLKNPPKAHKSDEYGMVLTPKSNIPIEVVDENGVEIHGSKVGWGTKASILLGSYDCKYGRFATIKKIVVTELVAPPEMDTTDETDTTEEDAL
jgi:hypothetical protein